jgi:crotonobetainyl-CoA hydratase
MNLEHVIYEKRDRIAYITFNRPDSRNALNDDARWELLDIFQDFRNDPEVWVAIVTGVGDKAFSAGRDLKATAKATADGRPERLGDVPPFGAIVRNFELFKPVIAAVNGVAAGGGTEFALACDIIIAADHARFGLREPRVGVIAGGGGIHRLARQIPYHQAMGILLTGNWVSAQEAYRIGLANEVVPLADLMSTAERWANEILECSPLMVQLTKESALDGLQYTVDEALERDAPRFERMLASADFKEGPKAFSEKRKPEWVGR